MSFADNLSFAINVTGVTRYKLAKDLSVSQTSIANWVSGNRLPHTKTRVKIAQYFGTTLEKMDGDTLLNAGDISIKEKPASDRGGLSEIISIFEQLTPSNQAKLLELARFYLDDQRKSEESQ